MALGQTTVDRSPSVPRRVLVADDDASWRDLLNDELSSAGYEVTTAANGREAAHCLATDHIELAIIDLEMPVMDGRALRRWMLEQPRLATVPVLVLSAEKPRDEASLMADAVLVKSVGMPHLLAAMSRALTRR